MSDRIARCLGSLFRLLLVLVAFGASLTAPLDCALAVERRPTAPCAWRFTMCRPMAPWARMVRCLV